MLRQNHRWTTTLSLTAALALSTWVVADRFRENVAEVRHDRLTQGIGVVEFQRLYERGEVLVVDVRDEASYEAGRIAGAILVSLDDLEIGELGVADIRRLSRGRLVVAYCSCPTEASSLRAVQVLADRSIKAKALVGGYPRWAAAGGRIETGRPSH